MGNLAAGTAKPKEENIKIIKANETSLTFSYIFSVGDNSSRVAKKISSQIFRNDNFLKDLKLTGHAIVGTLKTNLLSCLEPSKLFLMTFRLVNFNLGFFPEKTDLKRLTQVMSKNSCLENLHILGIPTGDYVSDTNVELFQFLAACQHAYIKWTTKGNNRSGSFTFRLHLNQHRSRIYLKFLKQYKKQDLIWNNDFGYVNLQVIMKAFYNHVNLNSLSIERVQRLKNKVRLNLGAPESKFYVVILSKYWNNLL